MILSGIADEAGTTIERQIQAHEELGWQAMELRIVGGKNVSAELSDEEFDSVASKVEDSGLKVTCFASAVGNWSRRITDDFAIDLNELKTAIPRMQRLGTKFIRTMSWVGADVGQARWRSETIRRYRELVKIAEDGGVWLAHENCTGWAGLSAENMQELIETIDSDHLVVLFDIGNIVSHGYEPWSFYSGLKDLIRYVHIKDCRRNPAGGRSQDYAYVGQGDAMVREILEDLFSRGYDGVISIEPHVSSIVHNRDIQPSAKEMFDSYVRYGRMTVELIKQIKE